MELITKIDDTLKQALGPENTLLHLFARCLIITTILCLTLSGIIGISTLLKPNEAKEPQQTEPTATEQTEPTAPKAEQAPTSSIAPILTIFLLYIVLVLCSIAVYFIPTIVAISNHKANTAAIATLNIFLGFTYLGWVLALVWAFSKDHIPNSHPPRLS